MAELNGVPVTPDELKALALVNYGHFTSMRVEGRQVRGLSHHLERLARDARTLFAVDLDRDQVRQYINHAVGTGGALIARVTIFDPALELGHPGSASHPSVLVTARQATELPLPPLRVQSAAYTRDLPAVKHVGLFGALWHRRTAQLNGFHDAVFTDADRYLSEGPTWNLGFFDGDQVIWPNADVLPGVTMRLLQQVHDRTLIGPINLRDVPRMKAAFATSIGIGVRPIADIDDYSFPHDHPIFETLRKEYEEIPTEPLDGVESTAEGT